LGTLFYAEPSEKPELDNLGLPRIDARESVERVIEPRQVRNARGLQSFIKLHPPDVTTTLYSPARAREVHEDVAHELATNRQKVNAVFALDAGIRQPQIRLIYQSGGLKTVLQRLRAHMPVRESP
jgi:hypothetical protein